MVASPSTVPASPPVTPDPEQLLQAAVRERDPAAADRLLQQWVHRRGLAALEEFLVRLAISQGEEARQWLGERIQAPIPAASGTASFSGGPATPFPAPVAEASAPAAVAPEPTGSPDAPLPASSAPDTPDPLIEAPAAPVPPPSSAPIEAGAPAAIDLPEAIGLPAPLAATPPLPSAAPATSGQDQVPVTAAAPAPPTSPAPVMAPLEPATAESIPAESAGTEPDPAAEPAGTGPVAAAGDFSLEWNFDFDAAFPPLGGGTPPLAGDAADQPVREDAAQTPRRGPLARMRSLVRDYLGEARQALRGGPDQAGGAEPEQESTGAEPAGAAGPVSEEPIWTPAREEIPGRPAATGLPELPEIDAPAPAAPALSDLRSWLPGGEDELPRAS